MTQKVAMTVYNYIIKVQKNFRKHLKFIKFVCFF